MARESSGFSQRYSRLGATSRTYQGSRSAVARILTSFFATSLHFFVDNHVSIQSLNLSVIAGLDESVPTMIYRIPFASSSDWLTDGNSRRILRWPNGRHKE